MKSPIILAAVLVASMAGCAKYDTVTPELQMSMMSDLQAGKLNLDCGLKCRILWDTQSATITALVAAQRWQDVTVQVMKIGYGNDLAYFDLGEAAQGLGFQKPAIGYYTYALALAQGNNAWTKCAAGRSSGNDPCQGVDVVTAAPAQIAVVQAAIDQQEAAALAAATPPPVRHRHRHPAVVPASSTGGTNWVAPPPPAAGTPADAGHSAGWVAPPPPAQ